MTAAAWAAFFWAWFMGGLIVLALWPGRKIRPAGLGLALSLGLLVGLGVTSGTFFVASLLSANPARTAAAVEGVAVLALLGWIARRPAGVPAANTVPAGEALRGLQMLGGVGLMLMLVVAAVVSWRAYRVEPYGGWDGWAIWNMHARFMLRAGVEWPTLLSAPQLNWTHPDYPRLLPAAVARLWAWAGSEAPGASAGLSAALAAAGVGTLTFALWLLRGRWAAIGGAALLVGTPFLVTFSSNQHADLPLASYMTAAAILVPLAARSTGPSSGMWSLAGICTGFAAGTKNEGMLFAAVFTLVAGGQAWRSGGRRSLAWLVAGLVVAALPVLAFKIGYAPPNDLTTAVTERLAQVVNRSRHLAILSTGAIGLGWFGEWTLVPFGVMALPLLPWTRRTRLASGEALPLVLLGLMLLGYYGVYLLSPHDLGWHLETSLVRLLLQLWPLAILSWALVLPVPAAGEPAGPATGAGIGFVALSLVGGALVAALLTRQLAPGEIAHGRGAWRDVTAGWGGGWFAPERQESDRWAWSGGTAEILLQAENAPGGTGRVTFRLRGMGTRTVTITQAGQVLWQGSVAHAFVPVELQDLRLAAGTNVLQFATDGPGLPESPAGGRRLAFAVYNFELKSP